MNTATEKAGIKKNKPHGVRKTSVKAMSEAGVPRHQIIQITGHKSEMSLGPYDKISMKQHENISRILTGTCTGNHNRKLEFCIA